MKAFGPLKLVFSHGLCLHERYPTKNSALVTGRGKLNCIEVQFYLTGCLWKEIRFGQVFGR
jgi:hypothetical protein